MTAQSFGEQVSDGGLARPEPADEADRRRRLDGRCYGLELSCHVPVSERVVGSALDCPIRDEPVLSGLVLLLSPSRSAALAVFVSHVRCPLVGSQRGRLATSSLGGPGKTRIPLPPVVPSSSASPKRRDPARVYVMVVTPTPGHELHGPHTGRPCPQVRPMKRLECSVVAPEPVDEPAVARSDHRAAEGHPLCPLHCHSRPVPSPHMGGLRGAMGRMSYAARRHPGL